MTVCYKCKVDKSETDFYPSCLRNGDYMCKPCKNKAAREWSNSHPDKRREIGKNYQRRYRVTHKEWLNTHARAQNRDLKLKVFALLGGKCVREGCGITDFRMLQINHINGGGSSEYQGLKHSCTIFYRRILRGDRGIDDLELLCANHNMLYEYEQGRRFQ